MLSSAQVLLLEWPDSSAASESDIAFVKLFCVWHIAAVAFCKGSCHPFSCHPLGTPLCSKASRLTHVARRFLFWCSTEVSLAIESIERQ